ncbi:MAG TPA: AAA family ATPase [Myxococcales bacterium]
MASPSTAAPEGLEQGRRDAGTALKAVLDELERRYPERTCMLQQTALALVAREHLLVFGPPGTGKSEIASTLMRRLVDESGRPSLYARQIVETTVQTDLVGPVDFKTLTETGRTVYHLDEGVLNAEHAVLDEVFDGRDLLLRSILSVLNERELALGPVVHKARLQTAILTTNRYLSEVLTARPETLLAFTDRIAFACFVPKAFASPASRDTVLRFAADPPTDPPKTLALHHLRLLRQAAREVRLPDEVRTALASLLEVFSKMIDEAIRERKGFSPTSFLSPRTLAKSVGVLRAGVVIDKYVEGRDRPLAVTVPDLARLRWMLALGGPLAEDLSKVVQATSDPKEKWQLENVRLEVGAFERAFTLVGADYQRRAESEAKTLGMPELRARSRRLTPGAAAELAMLLFDARRQARSEPILAELEEMARGAALAFAEGAASGTLPPLPSGSLPARLAACAELSRMLAKKPEHAAQAAAIARQGTVEAALALMGLGSSDAGLEFDEKSAFTYGDLTERGTGLRNQISELEALGAQLEAILPDPPARPLAAVAAETRRKLARALRRRAMLLVGRQARDSEGWKAVQEVARRLEDLDKVVEALCPGEGKVRSYVLAARAGSLLGGELDAQPFATPDGRREPLAVFTAVLREGVERMEELAVEPWRALKVARPAIERRLQQCLQVSTSLPPPQGAPSETAYLSLLKSCVSGADRIALQELAGLAVLQHSPLVASLDERLAHLDVYELSLQVNFLARWLDDVMAAVPEPSEIASREEADAVWAHVSATRFFVVGWRDRDLAALQRRLASLTSVKGVEADARTALASLEAVAATADRFGRALLERRAELAAA